MSTMKASARRLAREVKVARYKLDLAGADPGRYTTPSGLWVEAYRKEVLPPFAHAAIEVLGGTFGGVHNAPINWGRAEICDIHVIVRPQYRSLSTWDFNELTRLVVLSHDSMIRVEVGASSCRLLEIAMHPRLTRSQSESISRRMPTMDYAVEFVRRTTGSREVESPAWLKAAAKVTA